VVSFPQQDLHLRSIDDSFADVLGAKRGGRGDESAPPGTDRG